MERSKPPSYKRILLKISGEAIEGEGSVFNFDTVKRISDEILQVYNLGVEIGLVVGGGNIIRGEIASKYGIDRNQSDYMGMLATVINGILFECILKSRGIPTSLQSALVVESVTEGVILKNTTSYLNEKRVVLFVAGTGNPYVTTDTAAALRACQIGADIMLKATKVDGVYDRDPVKYGVAQFYKTLTYDEVLNRKLGVMDMAAVSMCRDQGIPILVFNINVRGNLVGIVEGKEIGTIIKG